MSDHISISVERWNCARCGVQCERNPTKGQKPKYCSSKCRVGSMKSCEECGTARVRHDARWCSPCKDIVATRPKPSKRATLVQCAWCHALHAGINRLCSDECRTSSAAHQASGLKSEFRLAYEAGDSRGMLALIEQRATKDDDGCWSWPRLNRDGYPFVRIGKKGLMIHRLVIELTNGQPLGSQAAHHRCANTACVNPEHLQPVSFRENTAEMLTRHTYLTRIKELEAALAEFSPTHDLLKVIPVR